MAETQDRAGWPHRTYSCLLWLALLWAVWNCVYVYLFLSGANTHRIESAAILLVILLLPVALRSKTPPPPAASLPPGWLAALSALVIALWVWTYLPLINFPFLSDDYVFLDLYREVGDLGRAPQFFRPAFAAVFWLVSTIWSQSAAPFHVTSLALHLVSSWFVYTLARRLFHANGPALLCFTTFLLNPLQLEAVLWVSGLQELLWVFFVLAALVHYTGVQVLSLGRSVATLGLLALALGSKETAVCGVLLLPAADWALFRARRGPYLIPTYGLIAAEFAAYLMIRARFVQMEPTYFAEPSRYFIKQFLTTPYRFFAQPWNTSVADVPLAVLCASAVTLIALLFLAVAVRRVSRNVCIGGVIILASTLPVYSYFFVRSDLLSARYLYFATFGWGIVLAALVGAVSTAPRVVAALTGSLALLWAVSLDVNLRPWRVAGRVVTVLGAGIIEDGSGQARLSEWTTRQGVQVSFRGSVPYEYGGVGIFINGYDGFLRYVRRTGQR